jgi:large subunit ribosomal protein L10
MPAQKKIFTVDNLTQKINDAKALFLVGYQGLNVAQMTELRRLVKKAGGELEVVKNRLLKIAFKGSSPKIPPEKLETPGPTAVLWAYDDEISPLKALVEFANQAGLPELGLGILDQELLSSEKVKELSQIPGQKGLEARLLGVISAPLYGLTSALSWNLRKLTLAFKNIADKKTNH